MVILAVSQGCCLEHLIKVLYKKITAEANPLAPATLGNVIKYKGIIYFLSLVGIVSYLLVNFWYTRIAANMAS